jgi:hypothetical protein
MADQRLSSNVEWAVFSEQGSSRKLHQEKFIGSLRLKALLSKQKALNFGLLVS